MSIALSPNSWFTDLSDLHNSVLSWRCGSCCVFYFFIFFGGEGGIIKKKTEKRIIKQNMYCLKICSWIAAIVAGWLPQVTAAKAAVWVPFGWSVLSPVTLGYQMAHFNYFHIDMFKQFMPALSWTCCPSGSHSITRISDTHHFFSLPSVL